MKTENLTTARNRNFCRSWRWLALAAFCTGLTASRAAYAPIVPQGAAPMVHATPVDALHGAVNFVPDSDEFRPRPQHPPLDQIPPMPMPAPGEAAGLGQSTEGCSVHDPNSHVTWQLPQMPAAMKALGVVGGQGNGYGGSDGGGGEEGNFAATFGNMSRISNTGEFPWRMNCKLVMRFVDTGGTDRFFVASGSMIDAEVVLTAAHCVYARNPNGINIFDWAREIWVYPGWDGNGNSSAPEGIVFQNYGYARGTYFLAGTGYINDGDFDRDAGLICLTRAVGMLTGWYGWAWGFDCATIQSRTYYNASFPSQTCPTAGLHNGRDMYFWAGSIDACEGNQLRLITGGGNCLDTLWGGMSGSGLYYFSGDSRHVHAVASNSDRNVSGRYAKLWEQFINDMNGSFIPDCRGSTFDLQALNCIAAPQTVQWGESLTTLNHLAVNPSNGSKSGQHYYKVYLSANNNISSTDTLLDSQSYNWDFGPMSSVRVNMSAVTIPIDTPPGNYWIGVVYDDATDSAPGNNDTDEWDAAPLTIIRPPTLNDHFQDAFVIAGLSGSATGQNVGGTKQAGEPNHAGNLGGRSVWWRWTAPFSGTLHVDTFGSTFDTTLALYTGSSVAALTALASNDDSGGRQSAVELQVVSGTIYRIAVDGYNAAAGDITLHWVLTPAPPANDLFAQATGLNGVDVVALGQNFYATKQAGEPNHVGNPGGKSVWWRWTAPATGQVRVNTFGSDFDTLLAVYRGTTLNALTLAASNDDSAGGRQSSVAFQAIAGAVYQIAIDGYNGAEGHITLHLEEMVPPTIRITGMVNGLVQLTLTGLPGATYRVEGSSDLIHWNQVVVHTLVGSSLTFYDPTPMQAPPKFYRALELP